MNYKYKIKVNQIPVLLGLDKYNSKDETIDQIILKSTPKKTFLKNNPTKKQKYYVNRTPTIENIINKFYKYHKEEVKEINKNLNKSLELENIIITGSIYSITLNKENDKAILLIKQRKNRIFDNIPIGDEVINQTLMKLFNCNKLLYLQTYKETFDILETDFNEKYYNKKIIEPLINIFKNI